MNIDREKLLDKIADMLLSNGIKATTTDFIASKLQMSKRTLYEIFGSKENMVELAMKKFHNDISRLHEDCFKNSNNVMEAMVLCVQITKDWMSKANKRFFQDINELYSSKNIYKTYYNQDRFKELEKLFKKGAEEGYFRKDLNFTVLCRMLTIQMESLKRMEELFPSDISLVEVFDVISTSFLRSISSAKGIELLDNMNPNNLNV